MKQLNIFAKVLILISFAMTTVIMVSYLLVYFLLPGFYKNHETSRYETLMDELIEDMKNEDLNEAANLLTEFASQHDTDIVLYNSSREMIFEYYRNSSIDISIELSEGVSSSISGINMGDVERSDSIVLSEDFEWNESVYTLDLQASLEHLDEAKEVIVEIYPIAFVCCLVFAIIAAAIVSNLFVKPIKCLNETVRKMSKLEPDVYVEICSADEIGELSRNVNQLYTELNGTIETLGGELKKNQDAENKKIDFLRTISHELKTPIAAANALIEGMLYEIPPYDMDKSKYLKQCQILLEQAGELAKETLQFSKYTGTEECADVHLKDVIDKVSSEYAVLILSRQITYTEDIPIKMLISTNIGLFSKAISNIISNAVNYTPTEGRIHVYIEDEKLVISNSCTPILKGEMDKLFKKPYAESKTNSSSTGLGLYIVNQILETLHMMYWFVPAEDGSGMVFKIQIDS